MVVLQMLEAGFVVEDVALRDPVGKRSLLSPGAEWCGVTH